MMGAALILGGIMAVSAGLYELSNELSSQAAKIASDRSSVVQRAYALQGLANLKRDATRAQAYTAAMDKILVTEDRILHFPDWISGLAGTRQVTLNFSWDNDKSAAGADAPGYYGFTFDVIGSPQNTLDFMKDLELNAPQYLTSIDTFDLTRVDSNNYRITSRGKVFFKLN